MMKIDAATADLAGENSREILSGAEFSGSEILQIRNRILGGESTARAEVEKCLAAAHRDDRHCFLEILDDEALARADEIDRQITEIRARNSDKSPEQIAEIIVKKCGVLVGVPYAAKDNFLTKTGHTTAAAKILEGFESPLDATAIEKLTATGAILIGKTNLDAFAHGGSTENSAFGATKNAIDPARVAGGSSGGSAAAVARKIVPFALGSDTGGSIRQPASFNGVVGYKPTYGMISRYGVVAMASSTDVVGPIARTVFDVEILCQILSGQDGKDSQVLPDYFELKNCALEKPNEKILKQVAAPSARYREQDDELIMTQNDKAIQAQDDKNYQNEKSARGNPRPLKIGLVKEFLGEGIDLEVKNATIGLAEKLRAQGHQVDEVSLPTAKYALAIYYVVVPAEVSSNLARYDGIRYGARTKTAKTLDEVYGQSRDAGFVAENKRRVMIGAFVLSSGYFDAYYLQAQKARTLLIRDFDRLFQKYDFLLGPVAPTPAFKLGENVSDPLKMYLSDVMSVPSSLAGLPAISLPNGSTKSGLPIGAQIIARMKDDTRLLDFAREVEELNFNNRGAKL
ncbi:MAG: aspartyl/glutamyl-tRNA amidotransferase subunit A [Candidatus Nomurabacteria bacterium]|jgi:aspartyl-tRNA(Asn)/glutamyl-tRNA(Gln) amidotransferase subunit A|nr:aspartyl/glutamyl-tRNA amidotransferase subunit A [Candidatus Nomurabacteria bacterium]